MTTPPPTRDEFITAIQAYALAAPKDASAMWSGGWEDVRLLRLIDKLYAALEETQERADRSDRWKRRAHEVEEEMARLLVELKEARRSGTALCRHRSKDGHVCQREAGHRGIHHASDGWQWGDKEQITQEWEDVKDLHAHPQYAMYRDRALRERLLAGTASIPEPECFP